MNNLGTCDKCDREARWAIVVQGCADHKDILADAIKNAGSNRKAIEALRSTLTYYFNATLNKDTINAITAHFENKLGEEYETLRCTGCRREHCDRSNPTCNACSRYTHTRTDWYEISQ